MAFGQTNIIGGEEIEISQTPYQVSIELADGTHLCGGTVIGDRWILTAAHCAWFGPNENDPQFQLQGLVVHAGSTDQTDNTVGQRIPVQTIYAHPDYDIPINFSLIEHDVALFYLSSPLIFNSKVQPINYVDACNTHPTSFLPGTILDVTGWGQINPDGNSTDILRFAHIPIITIEEANFIHQTFGTNITTTVTANNLALFSPEAQQGGGDSGGPFALNRQDGSWVLMGNVSFAFNNSDDNNFLFPSIGVNLINYSNWIETISGISASRSGIDLYMKDRPWDLGKEPSGVDMGWISDDIWMRNQPDGFTNTIHENPEYSSSDPVYVYVRVRNNGCESSIGDEILSLHWAKASTSLSWPYFWNGSQTIGSGGPSAGNLINTQSIPVIEPGYSRILEFQWNNMPNPDDYEGINAEPWHFCLLARILSTNDPMTYPETYQLNNNVLNNNNIAWKNVTVVNFLPGIVGNPHENDEGKISVGGEIVRGGFYNFSMVEIEPGLKPLFAEAEVICTLDQAFWQKWIDGGKKGQGFTLHNLSRRELRITSPNAALENCHFQADERATMSLRFAFLTREATLKESYVYNVIQTQKSNGRIVGGEIYNIEKIYPERNLFYSDGGANMIAQTGEEVIITAADIGEPAEYNWYNASGELLSTGASVSIMADTSMIIKLESIADADGFKDYDDLLIQVNPHYIEAIFPNPASNTLNVTYHIESEFGQTANLEIISQSGVIFHNISLEVHSSNAQIEISNLPTGVFNAILTVNGTSHHVKSFSKL